MSYDSVVAADGPAAWWKLSDGSGSGTAADSSGNGHTGTATSVTFAQAAGPPGDQTASFNGTTSKIDTSWNPSFSTGFTVEAWLNLSGNAGANKRLVANAHTDFGSNFGFELMLNGSGYGQFYVGNGSIEAGVAGGYAPVPSSGWVHLAGTWDGSNINMYVNGYLVQNASLGFAGPITAGTQNVAIGYNPAYSGDFLAGLLSEVAIYNYGLTAAQVAGHYNAGQGLYNIYTLHDYVTAGYGTQPDTVPYTLGVQFSVSQNVALTGIRFLSMSGCVGLPTECVLYNADTSAQVPGTHNASPSWTGGAAGSGDWVKCAYDGSVILSPGIHYYACVFNSDAGATQWFAGWGSFWTLGGPGAAGRASGPLSAPNNAAALHGQGPYNAATSLAVPNIGFDSFDWGVDVEVTPVASGSVLLMASFP
jgi:hypothetical protein